MMNKDSICRLERGVVDIGDAIALWRCDDEARKVLEPKAFKTSADGRAHKLLTDLILHCFSGATVLSEEDPNISDFRPEKYWLIDPIDGTASWYGGFDGFVTQISYIEDGVPLYGAVYAPVLKKLWTAEKGMGAWLNGKLMPQLVPQDRLNIIDNYPEPRRIAHKVIDNIQVTKYIECGSLGLKSCLVADATADLFVKDVVICDWDIAPAAIIIGEVGGVMCNLSGDEIKYSGSFEKNEGLIVARDNELVAIVISIAARVS